MMKAYISLVILSMALLSCTVAPVEIQYGADGCHFCKMTIVDRQHAAQLVTDTGKAFKYDAIECMLHDLKAKEKSSIRLFLINDYATPGELIDATTSTFLISKKIQSPMGAFLSGFSQKNQAQEASQLKGDQLFDWREILNHKL